MKMAVSMLAVAACLASGCDNGNSEEVAALRKDVTQLRKEVDALKARERGRSHGDWRPQPGGGANGGTASAERRQRPTRMTPEEMKARFEAMRDPEKREQFRAEHRARMGDRRRGFEGRPRQQQADDARRSDAPGAQDQE